MKKFKIFLFLYGVLALIFLQADESNRVSLKKCEEMVDGIEDLKINEEDDEQTIRSKKKCKSFCKLFVKCLAINGKLFVNGVDVTNIVTSTGNTTTIINNNGILDYAYIYRDQDQVVGNFSDVIFTGNGPMSSGITHTVGTSSIILANAGTYAITYSVTATSANQFALTINGSVLPETIYGIGGVVTASPNVGRAIIVVGAGSTLTLRNVTGSPVTLFSKAGGPNNAMDASILIERIA